MSTYLVVMDQDVSARSLRFGLLNHVSEHRSAGLVLLQSAQRLSGESEEQSYLNAAERMSFSQTQLAMMGVPVIDAVVGDPMPRKAIADELQRRRYEGIILASAPSSMLRFLHFDLASQLERKYHLPVTFVDPDSAVDTETALFARLTGVS